MFRGREVQHPELGRRILDDIADEVEDVAKVEVYPRLDGRNMVMVLGPAKRQSRKQAARSASQAAEEASAAESAQ